MRIDPDGTQQLIAQTVVQVNGNAHSVARYILEGTLPNGLAFDADGNFVIANFGTDAIERMTRHGHSETLFTQIEGKPIGKANFALADSRGRIWITVHTRRDPWTLSVNEKTPDGCIALTPDGRSSPCSTTATPRTWRPSTRRSSPAR
jgi:gluconolactonase